MCPELFGVFCGSGWTGTLTDCCWCRHQRGVARLDASAFVVDLAEMTIPTFRSGLAMTDETQLSLDGTVQKANCRIWGEENPHMP